MNSSDFYGAIADDIARNGLSTMGVMPREGDSGFPFTYTIGNAERGLPELLLIGSGNGSALHQLSRKMVDRGRAFGDGEIVDLGGKVPVKVVNASDYVKGEYTIQVGRYYHREDYAVQQVVVPDREGRFPGDEGCAEPFASFPVHRAEELVNRSAAVH